MARLAGSKTAMRQLMMAFLERPCCFVSPAILAIVKIQLGFRSTTALDIGAVTVWRLAQFSMKW